MFVENMIGGVCHCTVIAIMNMKPFVDLVMYSPLMHIGLLRNCVCVVRFKHVERLAQQKTN